MTAHVTSPLSTLLPTVAGRAPRIAILLYGSPDHDSRVLKTTATLRAAGAEVLLVGRSIIHSGAPEGHATVAGDLPVYRTQDLDLTRTLPRLTRAWRRMRGRSGPLPHASAGASDAVTRAEVPSPTTTRPGVAPRPASAVRAWVGGAWMRGYDVARIVRYWVEAASVVARFGADVVHANDANTLAPAIVLRAARGTRIVYDSHELWRHRSVRHRRVLAPVVEALIERCGARTADAVITVSPSIATWLQEHYRLPTTPGLVRNIPVRAGPVPDRDEGRLRELTGLSRQDRVLAYCGGIVRGRGLEEVVAALPELSEDVHLVLLGVGSPAYLASLEERAQLLGVAGRVHQAGRVPGPDIPTTLADADASMVFSRPTCLSHLYSLPNKLFESIHAGVPVAAADLPDIAAVVRETGAGEVVDTASPQALAEGLQRVLAHGATYRAAARLAAPRFDWAHEAQHLLAAHATALARHRR